VAISTELILNASQQDELVAISQSRSLPAGYVFRAKLILMLAEGASFRTIKHKLGTTAPTIVRWKERFLSGGIDGLDTYHPGQPPSVLTPALRARILGAGAGGPHHSGQSVGAQESGGSRFSGDASERAFPLHADVFVVAESSRDLVFQGRARRDCSRNLYQREGSGPQASPLYQRLLSER
jgi:Winged helix-turn helix